MVEQYKKHILKVRENKTNKQKSITIPKEAEEIQAGDYVDVRKHETKEAEEIQAGDYVDVRKQESFKEEFNEEDSFERRDN